MLNFLRYVPLALLLAAMLPSAAAAAKAKERIIIGVIPETNLVKQMERFGPLSDYLKKKTGFDIDVRPLSNYGQLYDEINNGNIDAGFFGSFVYAMTRARIGIIPLVRPVQPGGKSTYTGFLFVRKDSGIRKPSDMKGKTIALVDPATTAGYLTQKEYLKNNGINMDKDLKIFWAGNHEAAIRAVLSNQAQIGGAKDTVVKKYRKEYRMFDTVIEIVNENPKKGVPDNTLAVRRGLAAGTREQLRKTLLSMNSTPEGRAVLADFGAVKFIATDDDDFSSLYTLIRHLKIDLKNYPYKKHP